MATLGEEAVSLHFLWRKRFEHVIWYSNAKWIARYTICGNHGGRVQQTI